MKLTLATRTKDGIFVVDCNGRIVFGEESLLLRDTVKKALSENNRIVLNLGEVNYIDSGGLGTLVALRTSAQKAGGTIKLTRLTKRVSDLLQITKLLTVFDVYNSEAEAVESFRKAA
jgi:anti-sigma B factor antagonist